MSLACLHVHEITFFLIYNTCWCVVYCLSVPLLVLGRRRESLDDGILCSHSSSLTSGECGVPETQVTSLIVNYLLTKCMVYIH